MLGLGRKKTKAPEATPAPAPGQEKTRKASGAPAADIAASTLALLEGEEETPKEQREDLSEMGDESFGDGGTGKGYVGEEAAQSVRDAVMEQAAAESTSDYATEEDLLKLYATQVGMPFVKLSEIEFDEEALNLVSPELARQYKVFPVRLNKQTSVVTIALVDPLNVRTIDDLRVWLGHEIEGVIGNADEIQSLIDEYYGTGQESVDEVLSSLQSERYVIDLKEENFGDLERIANEAPIVKLVNLVLLQAIKERASDLHIEPFERSLRIRYRVDGILHETVPPPKHLTNAIISRVKVMAGLNIAERRLPQDGRIKLAMADRNVELRVSCLPTVNGESVVMRILDSEVMGLQLDQLGMLPDTLEIYEKVINRPNGIVLVTGPTGCGKTTSMYASLARIFSPMLKMITTENPVEYQMDGIVQVNINQAVGLTFARCLRSILRQDPDIIMVGEIRDLETASMAIESSLTGHLVLSTLHTNDAPGTLTRLIDMDVEPFLITSAVVAVVAQRLVRVICLDCKEPYTPDPYVLKEMGVSPEDVANITFFHGKGCSECNYTGYRGRAGIFELLTLTDLVKELVLKRAASSEIFHQARKDGMRTLREDGWQKVIQGITTPEEILHSTVQ
ncbi:MAG TPA: ATPase, T2SS/T4P/T4SS family [bacterium]|nr:ATPase, T2SS/T4P/T4SS family [bacterium]HQP98467.1 ATPase, T2SS/T4P/T4SS family [bacterium]